MSTVATLYGEPLGDGPRRTELVVVEGRDEGRAVILREGRDHRVGTAPDCDLVLTDERVSAHHVRVRPDGDGFEVEDEGSTNGTHYQGSRIGKARLPAGAVLKVGRTVLRVQPLAEALDLPPSRARRFGELVGESLALRQAFAVLELAARSDVTVLLEGETGTGKGSRRGPCTRPARGGGGRSWPSIAVRCPSRWSTRSCSATCVGRSPAPPPIATVRSPAPAAARCSSTRSTACPRPCRRASCGRSRSARSGRWERIASCRWTCGWWWRARPRCRRGWPRAASARISSIASPCCTCGCPRSASGARTSLRSWRSCCAVAAFLGQTIDGPVLQRLCAHDWPGNVRELRNVIDRAIALSPGAARFEDLRLRVSPREPEGQPLAVRTDLPFADAKAAVIEEFERRYLGELWARSDGNLSAAARQAGLDRKHLRTLLRRYGILPEPA